LASARAAGAQGLRPVKRAGLSGKGQLQDVSGCAGACIRARTGAERWLGVQTSPCGMSGFGADRRRPCAANSAVIRAAWGAGAASTARRASKRRLRAEAGSRRSVATCRIVPCTEAVGCRTMGAQLNFRSVRKKCGRRRWRRSASDPERGANGKGCGEAAGARISTRRLRRICSSLPRSRPRVRSARWRNREGASRANAPSTRQRSAVDARSSVQAGRAMRAPGLWGMGQARLIRAD
jgi:hypothetical protein